MRLLLAAAGCEGQLGAEAPHLDAALDARDGVVARGFQDRRRGWNTVESRRLARRGIAAPSSQS
jgi:hypothetical protein